MTQRFIQALIKILFSAVILALFGLCITAEGDVAPAFVRQCLEHAAMSCVLILGGGLLLEYVHRSDT